MNLRNPKSFLKEVERLLREWAASHGTDYISLVRYSVRILGTYQELVFYVMFSSIGIRDELFIRQLTEMAEEMTSSWLMWRRLLSVCV